MKKRTVRFQEAIYESTLMGRKIYACGGGHETVLRLKFFNFFLFSFLLQSRSLPSFVRFLTFQPLVKMFLFSKVFKFSYETKTEACESSAPPCSQREQSINKFLQITAVISRPKI